MPAALQIALSRLEYLISQRRRLVDAAAQVARLKRRRIAASQSTFTRAASMACRSEALPDFITMPGSGRPSASCADLRALQ